MKVICFLLAVLSMGNHLSAQDLVRGFIRDKESNEKLIGAHIIEKASTNATISDNNGYFSLFIKTPIEIEISFVGYKKQLVKIQPGQDSILTILLEQGSIIDAVTVSAYRNPQSGVLSLSHAEMTAIPSLGAKPDVLKTIQLLPGVQPGQEGSSYISVRGGDPGQNLYLIDNAPLIYVNHLGGFMSVFNPDIINNLKIYKGTFPAMYGGKLSSIVDITQKEGNNQTPRSSVSIGLTDISATFEGPLKNKNTSYIISGRKTLFDPLLWLASSLSDGQDFKMLYGFHDINGKLSRRYNDKNSVHFNLYHGDDYLIYRTNKDMNNISEKAGTQYFWGNWLLSGNWKHVMGEKLLVNSGVSWSRYRSLYTQSYSMNSPFDRINHKMEQLNILSDFSFRSDWKYSFLPNWKMGYGLHSGYLFNIPQRIIKSGAGAVPDNSQRIEAFHTTLYWEHDIRIAEKVRLNPGIRAGYYVSEDWNHIYFEPRTALGYHVTRNQLLNLSYMKVHQHNHMLLSDGAINNREIWIASHKYLLPSLSEQVSFGWEFFFRESMFHAEINAYYKTMSRLAVFKPGYREITSSSDGLERNGTGRSAGVELMVKKNYGQWSGFLAYTFSITTRQFENINQGKVYPYEFDRPHSASLSLNRKINTKLTFNALWVYQTGLPFTPALGRQFAPGINLDEEGQRFYYEAFIYGERNSSRMRDYHRMDVSLQYNRLTKYGRPSEWTFSVYNAYNRRNPWYCYYNNNNTGEIHHPESGDAHIPVSLYQISLFPIIPTLSYKVYFDKSKYGELNPGERIKKWLFME